MATLLPGFANARLTPSMYLDFTVYPIQLHPLYVKGDLTDIRNYIVYCSLRYLLQNPGTIGFFDRPVVDQTIRDGSVGNAIPLEQLVERYPEFASINMKGSAVYREAVAFTEFVKVLHTAPVETVQLFQALLG